MTEKLTAITIRTIPESLRRALKSKAAAEGKTVQNVIIELITKYAENKD